MYVERIIAQRPQDNALIWRYLNFAKFVSMLASSNLYFARLDRLGDDNYEGTLPRGTLLDHSAFTSLPENERTAAAEQHNRNVINIARKQRQGLFVNCWHINNAESDAMWKLYLKENEGVAVQSTFKRLKDGLAPSPQHIDICEINYADYNTTEIVPGFAHHLAIHKRHHYKYENELRAIYWDGEEALRVIAGQQETNSKIGIPIRVDLTTLIDKIYCSPRSSKWFHSMVESVLEKYGYAERFPVLQSAMSHEPIG